MVAIAVGAVLDPAILVRGIGVRPSRLGCVGVGGVAAERSSSAGPLAVVGRAGAVRLVVTSASARRNKLPVAESIQGSDQV